MIGKYTKDYRELYRKILEIVKNCVNDNEKERENFVNKIGELVIIEYGLSYKSYKNNITSSPASKTISEKKKEILKEISNVVSEYENNLIEVELPMSQKLIDFYIVSKEIDGEKYCESSNLDDEEKELLSSYKNYCKTKDIDNNIFKRSKKIIFLYDKKRNALLNKEQTIKEKIKIKFIAEEIENIAYLLVNGIELENGETRKFDLIDYYECTNIKTTRMYSYLSSKRLMFDDMLCFDISKIKRFLNGINTNAFLNNPIDEESKINDVVKFAEKDENGKIIENSFRIITEEEKKSLIEYLKSHEIPLIEGTYEAGIRRIRNNTFGLGELNKTSKNKQLILK